MARDLQQRVGNAVQQRPAQQGTGIESSIRSMEKQFALAMPKGAEAAQLVRDAITVLRQNPKLGQCEPASLMGALMSCAQLGLRPGIGALGHAYILPFWSGKARRFEAQFIIGYQGMIELANRSKEIDYFTAEMVCENDTFIVDPLGGRHRHEYPAKGRRGEVYGYYAAFYRKGSERAKLVYMSKEDMEDHRDKFATAKTKEGKIFGPWVDHFDAMALKTVIRAVFKFMPRSTEIQSALIADESTRVDANPVADMNEVARHEAPDAIPGELDGTEGADQETGELPDGVTQEQMDAVYAQEQADYDRANA
jgi:recombination protein RecT